jgi:cell wall-associated NlpC family hydrolase
MNRRAKATVERARAMIGVPFRPQGRDPATGIDCIGLVLCVFEIPEDEVRRDYRLADDGRSELDRELRRFFRRLSAARRAAGDVVLCNLRRGQCHLAIDCGSSFIHADARLRRVVETPGSPPWPLAAAYRPKLTRTGSN